jgi:phage FluMu protein gp41
MSEKTVSELTGKDGGPIQYEDISQLSDEELANLSQTSESGTSKA